MFKKLMSTAVLLTAVTTVSAASLRFDFGRTDTQMPFGSGWNNVVPATSVLFATFDSDDNLTDVGFEITNEFFQVGEPSHLGSFNPAGDAAMFPQDATSDFFFGHVGPFGGQPENPLSQFKLFNLDQALTYDFTFFASRQPVGDNRETLYTANGANSGSAMLNPSNNDTEIVTITGISPDANGEIFIDVEAGPNNNNGTGFYYLNVMQMDIIPEPASALALVAFGALAIRRR